MGQGGVRVELVDRSGTEIIIMTAEESGVVAALSSFLATYIAGALHPLDIIKTRFQSHDGKARLDNLVPKYEGIVSGLKTIAREEGFKGLYKGFHISILSQASATALFFGLYERRRKTLEDAGAPHMSAVARASMEASLVGTIATQPLWVIKTRMLLNVVPGVTEMQNLRHSCRQIYKQDGALGYCRGLGLSLVLSLSGIVQMYSYEALKRLWVRLGLPQSGLQEKNFVCGALCKLVVVVSNYPITTVRTRVQQNQFVRDERTMKYHGAWEVVVRTWRDEGLRGFYKGFGANLLKGVLQKGVYFYAYEWLRRVGE